LDSYRKSIFITETGQKDLTTVVTRVSDIFKKYGFTDENKIQKIADVTIYPAEYFCPKNYETGEINITENTYSIHHYDASWITKNHKWYNDIKYRLFKKFGVKGKILLIVPFLIYQIKDYGLFGVMKKVFKRGK